MSVCHHCVIPHCPSARDNRRSEQGAKIHGLHSLPLHLGRLKRGRKAVRGPDLLEVGLECRTCSLHGLEHVHEVEWQPNLYVYRVRRLLNSVCRILDRVLRILEKVRRILDRVHRLLKVVCRLLGRVPRIFVPEWPAQWRVDPTSSPPRGSGCW